MGVLKQVNKWPTKNDKGPMTCHIGREKVMEVLRQVNKSLTKNDEVPKTGQFGREKVKGFQRQSNWMEKGDGGVLKQT